MQEFLARKNIEVSLKKYGIEALNAMALGLFGSLIVGLIFKSVGQWLDLEWLINFGSIAQSAMGAAIGVGVAYVLQAPILVLVSVAVVGLSGASLGGPVGCFVAVLFATEIGKIVSKTTPVDIIITPAVTLFVGLGIAQFTGPYIQSGMEQVGAFIEWAVDLQPFLMGIIVAVIMGILLTLPISSAAIAIALSLSGISAGAATVGCCAQMIGFAVMSYRENGWGGFISQGLGTSMLQLSNIVKNPKIWIPPIIASAILGPIATIGFKMLNVPSGAGMGTSGFVGQIGTLEAMGNSSKVFLAIGLLHFVAPAIICLLICEGMRKIGWIKWGDLKLNNG
ncbi:PTS sugar transporter subunit IIC [Weeksellaceae bacterium TAE3-ERU29]|nr:PTS sugar transporter subunit IIC [Weeksellaceae bacterium TAE3-ERU29]